MLALVTKGFTPFVAADITKPGSLTADQAPSELAGVGIKEQLGETLDLDLLVTDDQGQPRALRTFFDGQKPVLLSLVYYNCPGLCSLHLNGLIDGLKLLDWSPAKEFTFLTLSFDSKESFDLGAAKKKNYLKVYGKPNIDQGWHFLTASEQVVQQLTQKVGFSFKWDEAGQEWAHSSAAIFLSPEGKITRYLHGVVFEPDQLRLAFNEAASGTVGTIVDHLVWYCFKYDPQQSKYVIYAFRLVQLGGGLIVILLALILLPTWWRERKKKEIV